MKHRKENQLLNWQLQKGVNARAEAGAQFIKFTAETRSSGMDTADRNKDP